MHLKRLVVAAVLVPVFYLYIMYLPPEFFLFLMIFFSTIGLMEFYAMFGIKGVMKYSGLFWGAAILAVFYVSRPFFHEVLMLAILATMTLRLFFRRDPSGSGAEVSAALLGILYIPGLLAFQLDLVKADPVWIILLYASVWASDSMAYYVGKGMGKRKLYPEISPNKTVAGGVGSVFGGMLGALIIKAALFPQLSFPHALILGAAVGFTTIIGDLVESMFKRDSGVKDSSQIIPGHGGVLDKIDGVTFAGPVFFWICAGLGLI